MSPVVRPYWLVLVFGLTSLVQAQPILALPTVVLALHGGYGHSGGSIHGSSAGFAASGFSPNGHGGMNHGVPGGFLASGFSNHYGGYGGYGSPYGFGGGYGFGLGYGYGYTQNYGYGFASPLVYNYATAIPVIWPVFVPTPIAGGGFGGSGFGGGGGGRGGLMLPMPPMQAANPNPAPRARNTVRAKELVEIGDRSFKAGNIKRAEEKYQLAARTDPTIPNPHVHMAQVSLSRGDYVAAADHLRDAVTIAGDGGWLLNAPDIQAIFGEPANFARQLARLESHLQANPTDRDAWFVLGAEYYLSGRSKQAADVFQRLTDRKPDEALAAFMDASKTKLPAAVN